MSDEYWLPDIVHLHLTAHEAGWLMAHLDTSTDTVEVNVRGPDGEKIRYTMAEAIGLKLREAWANHD